MKRLAVLPIVAFAIILFRLPAFADENISSRSQDTSYCNGTFRGGYFLPEDRLLKKMYGKWSNDIYFLEMGCFPIQNLLISGSVGGYYQRGHPIGEISGEKTDAENLTLTMMPLGVGIGWRFRFTRTQPIVPFLGSGYDWVFISEDPDPGSPVNGWKQGFMSWGGFLILLDNAEREAATYMKMNYSVEHTYLELSAKYSFVGEPNGLNLRGWMYMIGLSFDF